jgi:peptidoglycan/xylan/chitin deacetylase (PgdA/CDA1 family)
MPLASAVKRIAEAGLLRSGAAALGRRRVSGRTLVLAYHNVVADNATTSGDGSLHIPLRVFLRHIDAIQERAEVVPLAALAGGAADGRPRVVITFDDAYRGTLRHALRELAGRGLPATVFVPPAFVPGATFWWDDLGRAGHGLEPADRDSALGECRGRDAEVRRRFAARLEALPAADPDLRCATLEELQAAVAAGPVTFGSHTWSHPNLARASAAELQDELARPLAWLRDHFPERSLPAISYPYGLRSPTVESAARDAGYTMGFLVSGGWLPAQGSNPFALPRLNVPAGMSADGLALRLSGLFA